MSRHRLIRAHPGPDPARPRPQPVAKTEARNRPRNGRIDVIAGNRRGLNYCRASFHRIRKQPTKR
ncbi:MAG: hypothetical protein Ct9H300mP1_10620 [Planctomycetaceae bacterium]|nr:MAG: hypothetical protein Ct9H300mP1_10620 [Planctomycetaceae bacterium]